MSEEFIKKLGIVPTECHCKKCKAMCHAPCCGSVEDFERLIEAGYADRLMLDDLPSDPNGGDMLKPALRGHEGRRSPWETSSVEGCTFWNRSGKCDLHNLGLKPTQGRLAIHDNPNCIPDSKRFASLSKEDWESDRGLQLIKRWKTLVGYDP